jgi:hypothetical protein
MMGLTAGARAMLARRAPQMGYPAKVGLIAIVDSFFFGCQHK